MSQPLCYFHNWVREIFENRFFRGSWCSGVVEQESFGTEPCAIQTEIYAANRGSIPQKDAATYANGGEPAHYGQNCESLFELCTAVYQKIHALLCHWTSSIRKTNFFWSDCHTGYQSTDWLENIACHCYEIIIVMKFSLLWKPSFFV